MAFGSRRSTPNLSSPIDRQAVSPNYKRASVRAGSLRCARNIPTQPQSALTFEFLDYLFHLLGVFRLRRKSQILAIMNDCSVIIPALNQ